MTFFKKKGSTASRTVDAESRNRIRSCLKKSGQGNTIAFSQICEQYADFIVSYLFLLGHSDPANRNAKLEEILVKSWKYLPYTKRVSDFERFLYIQLADEKPIEDRTFPAPHENLSQLRHEQRFLLCARIFAKWNYKALKLAVRASEKEIAAGLMNLKCKLIGFQSHLLKQQEKARIIQISELLEGNIPEKHARKIESQIATEYSSLQFKADWLSYRCELAELLESIRLSTEDKGDLITRLLELIKQQPMERPKLSDNISNLLSFDAAPVRGN